MKLITNQTIKQLGISPAECVEWIRHSFMSKHEAELPAKLSIHPQNNDFFNVMPCLLPQHYHRFGVKVVHRIKGAVPSLGGDILLYDSQSGDLLAMLDSDWITTMRTGAVATLALQTLRSTEFNSLDNIPAYGFLGLGNTARATLLCLLESERDRMHRVLLLRYKNQAENFIERFRDYTNVEFSIVETPEDLISNSLAVISCITEADGIICENNDCFQPGITLLPVHTRGFQNCDLFFDKVYADDTAHVSNFKYFDRFKRFAELSDVLHGTKPGRESNNERILSYNIGLGLHDVFFANNIFNIAQSISDLDYPREQAKFWI